MEKLVKFEVRSAGGTGKRFRAHLIEIATGKSIGGVNGSFSDEAEASRRGNLIVNGNAEYPIRRVEELQRELSGTRNAHANRRSEWGREMQAMTTRAKRAERSNAITGTIIAVVSAVVGAGLALLVAQEFDLVHYHPPGADAAPAVEAEADQAAATRPFGDNMPGIFDGSATGE